MVQDARLNWQGVGTTSYVDSTGVDKVLITSRYCLIQRGRELFWSDLANDFGDCAAARFVGAVWDPTKMSFQALILPAEVYTPVRRTTFGGTDCKAPHPAHGIGCIFTSVGDALLYHRSSLLFTSADGSRMIFVCVLVGAVVRVLTLEERVSVPLTIIDETRWCCMEGTEAVGMFIHSFLPADIASVIKLQDSSLALSILLSNRRPIWGHLCLCMCL